MSVSAQGGSCRQPQGSARRARPVPHPQATGGHPPGTEALGRAAGPAPSPGGDPRAIQTGWTHRPGCGAPAVRVPMATGRDAPPGSPGRGLPALLCPAPLGPARFGWVLPAPAPVPACAPPPPEPPGQGRTRPRSAPRPARAGAFATPFAASGAAEPYFPDTKRPSLPPTGTDLWFARSGVTRKEISAAPRSWILGENSRTALCAVGEVRYERAPHQNYRFPKALCIIPNIIYYSDIVWDSFPRRTLPRTFVLSLATFFL